MKIFFTITNSVDPDEILHYAALHLGLHCLQNYSFRGFLNVNKPLITLSHLIYDFYACNFSIVVRVILFVLILYIPVNNFSVANFLPWNLQMNRRKTPRKWSFPIHVVLHVSL